MENNKITEEERTKIIEQQSVVNELIGRIGVIETQKHALLHKLYDVNMEIETYKNELEESYGSIEINMDDGTYTVVEPEVEEVTENV